MHTDRETRRAELNALQLYDLVALLAIYRQGADLNQLAKRPGGVTFPEMIAAILDREHLVTWVPKQSWHPGATTCSAIRHVAAPVGFAVDNRAKDKSTYYNLYPHR